LGEIAAQVQQQEQQAAEGAGIAIHTAGMIGDATT